MKKILIDKAYDETVKHNTYLTWNSLKLDLKNRFAEVRSKLQVSQELNTISQGQNEDVRSFGSRVQTLLSQLNDICIVEAVRGSEVFVDKINSQTALIAFQEGLNPSIRLIVKAANCNSLRDSITRAAEEEILMKRHVPCDFSNKSNLIKCQFCKKSGHTADKCFRIQSNKKLTNNNNSQSFENSTQSDSYNKSNKTNNINCAYCKKFGHHINNCYSRKSAEEKKNQNNSNLSSKPSTQKSSTQTNFNITKTTNQSENSNRLEQQNGNRAVRAKDL